MRMAPRSAAVSIGVLPPTAPSIRWCSPMRTDGNAAGIAALARIASTAGPDDKHTAVPPRLVATTCTGIGASSRFANGMWRSISLLRLDGSIKLSAPTMTPSMLRSVTGNTSRRRSPRQILSRLSIPRGIGRACEVSGVHRSHGRANDEIRLYPRAGQLAQHADLNSSQTAAAGKDEGRPLTSTGHDLSLRDLRLIRSLSELAFGVHAATAFFVTICKTSRGSARSR